MTVPSVLERAQRLQLMASQLAPELHSIATAGSMVEAIDKERQHYLTESQNEVIAETRSFAELVIVQGGDLRESRLSDITLATAWNNAGVEPPGLDTLKDRDTGLIERASLALIQYGSILRDWQIENPNWRKITKMAIAVTALASIVVGAATVLVLVIGGAAAVAAVPLIVANAGIGIATGIATVARVLVE
jgi:hypothetical protein